MRRQIQNALISFICVLQSSNLVEVVYGQLSPEKSLESWNRCCHGNKSGAQKGEKCVFLVFLAPQKWVKIFLINWHQIGCTKGLHNLKIVVFSCMSEHITGSINPKFFDGWGALRPLQTPALTEGGTSPLWDPPDISFCRQTRRKNAQFFAWHF